MANSSKQHAASRTARRAAGVYYTPAPIVRQMVEQTLAPLWESAVAENESQPPSIAVLDPACGAGVFLIEAYRWLLQARAAWYTGRDPERFVASGRLMPSAADQSGWRLTTGERRRVLLEQVYGVELDPQTAHQTRLALANLALPSSDDRSPSAPRGYALDELLAALAKNIQQGDALLGPDIRRAKFDAVLTNPPYVNIRLLSKTYDARAKRYLATRYQCARGNYDLYVLFVERAFELLRPGGRCGMIVPNKLATLQYAQPCRDLLLGQTTLHTIADVSGLRIFPDAGVYPYIVVWEKTAPAADHLVRVLRARSVDDLAGEPLALRIAQGDLAATGSLGIDGSLAVETRVPTEPLGSRTSLHSGATGFSAQQLAGELVEHDELDKNAAAFEFIVSGNIDRYLVTPGDVRFMKRAFTRPMLPKAADGLSRGKQQLYQSAKIVIAGMTRRLEAAPLDPGGLALGVQVYAAADCRDDPRYLLALLNSKLLSYLFRTRFRAKELSGGYLAINKGQLAQLPIRTIDDSNPVDAELRDKLVRLAGTLLDLHARRCNELDEHRREQLELLILQADNRIDELVYRLYRLSVAEVKQVETEFESPLRNTAHAA